MGDEDKLHFINSTFSFNTDDSFDGMDHTNMPFIDLDQDTIGQNHDKTMKIGR